MESPKDFHPSPSRWDLKVKSGLFRVRPDCVGVQRIKGTGKRGVQRKEKGEKRDKGVYKYYTLCDDISRFDVIFLAEISIAIIIF